MAGLSNEDNSTSDLTDDVSVVRGTHRWSCQTRTDYYVLTNASTKPLRTGNMKNVLHPVFILTFLFSEDNIKSSVFLVGTVIDYEQTSTKL